MSDNPCAWCELPSHITQGRIRLCAAHYRISNMCGVAKRNGKVVPTRSEVEALVPEPFVCSPCGRPMKWLRDDGSASQQVTLQHDRSGSVRLICFGCNTRHALHPGDSFYDIPAGHKRCPDCEIVQPIAAFSIDKSRPIGRKSYCRPCSKIRHQKWEIARVS